MNKEGRKDSSQYLRAHITGCGSSVPDKTLTNDDLSEMVDTSDEWMTTRTGIKKKTCF